MKKIFLSIGLAALMLVSGTNVYLANQRTEMETNLSLENLEAEGIPVIEFIAYMALHTGIDLGVNYGLDPIVNYLTNGTSGMWAPVGDVSTREEHQHNYIYLIAYRTIRCVSATGSECIPPHETEEIVYKKQLGQAPYRKY